MTTTEVLRRFNRTYTQRIGVLDESFLGTGRPLAVSRLLFEVGSVPGGTTVRPHGSPYRPRPSRVGQVCGIAIGAAAGRCSRTMNTLAQATKRPPAVSETYGISDPPGA